MWPSDDGFVIWQNGQAHNLGVTMDQISAFVDTKLSGYLPAVNNAGNYSNVYKFLEVVSPVADDEAAVLTVGKN